LLELIGIQRLARPIDPLSDLATGLEAYAQKPIDDDEPNDDEPLRGRLEPQRARRSI